MGTLVTSLPPEVQIPVPLRDVSGLCHPLSLGALQPPSRPSGLLRSGPVTRLLPASSLTTTPGVPFLSLPCPRLVLLPFTCENTLVSLLLRKVPGRLVSSQLPQKQGWMWGLLCEELGEDGLW